ASRIHRTTEVDTDGSAPPEVAVARITGRNGSRRQLTKELGWARSTIVNGLIAPTNATTMDAAAAATKHLLKETEVRTRSPTKPRGTQRSNMTSAYQRTP